MPEPTILTVNGLKWRVEALPGRGLRLTAPPGFRVNWRTGIRILDREWTTVELELEEKRKGE